MAAALAVKRARDGDPEAEGLTDPVTGLGNRRLGERELDLFVARSTRHGHALSLVKARLDGFDARSRPAPPTRCCTTPAPASPARCAAAT